MEMDNNNFVAPELSRPPQPVQYAWIVQRQETDGQSASIWKFGFLSPDGAEVRVTFHQVSQPAPDQSTPPQAPPVQNNGIQPGGSDAGAGILPAGQPNPDQTNDGVFYVTFFSNRNPEHFMKWDTSLSHEDSLVVWITVTHGLVDFLRKAKPQNMILDDLANGKLKMVLRSVSMDVVATDPDYTLEMTQKHEYRTFYQIKKGGQGSAFNQMVSGKPTEGDTNIAGQVNDLDNVGKVEGQDAVAFQQPTQDSPEQAPQAPPTPAAPTMTPSKKGLTVEIGRDYSIAVRDNQGNVVDRYRGKNPLDILRWLNTKGYAANKMKVVDQEKPSGVIAQTRNVAKPAPATKPDPKNNLKTEQFVIDGNKVVITGLLEAKRAAAMNYIVNADRVVMQAENVAFEFESAKDMNFHKALVELAYQRTEVHKPVKK